MNTNVIIHIGYHKTGTSWLQEELFPALEGVAVPFGFREILEAIITPHPFAFDEAQFWERHGGPLRGRREDVVLLSSERLSGSPHSGGYDAPMLARRLRRLFPEAKILLVVREQMGTIVSSYREYVRGGGVCSLEQYVDPPVAKHRPGFDPDYFRYDRMVELYRDLFPAERIEVLPFEWLKGRRARYVDEIADFVGAPVDKDQIDFAPVRRGISETATRIKRWTNRLTRRNSLNPCPALRVRGGEPAVQGILGRLDPLLSRIRWGDGFRDRVIDRFGGYYASSNSRLQEYMTADLEALGYEVD